MNVHTSIAYFTVKKIEAYKGKVTCPRLSDGARTEGLVVNSRVNNSGWPESPRQHLGSLPVEGGL